MQVGHGFFCYHEEQSRSLTYLMHVTGSKQTRRPLDATGNRYHQACAFCCGFDLVRLHWKGPEGTCEAAVECLGRPGASIAIVTNAVAGVVARDAVAWFVLAAGRSVAWRETLHGGSTDTMSAQRAGRIERGQPCDAAAKCCHRSWR